MSEVGLTERSGAVHTRLGRLQLPANTGTTWNLPSPGELPCIHPWRTIMACILVQIQCGSPWCGSSSPSTFTSPFSHHQPLKLGGDFSQDPVDTHLRFFGECLLAHGAGELLAVVPVSLQAGLAEAVATGCGDRLHEHLQTDGAAELLLWEDPASWRAYAWKKERRNTLEAHA